MTEVNTIEFSPRTQCLCETECEDDIKLDIDEYLENCFEERTRPGGAIVYTPNEWPEELEGEEHLLVSFPAEDICDFTTILVETEEEHESRLNWQRLKEFEQSINKMMRDRIYRN